MLVKKIVEEALKNLNKNVLVSCGDNELFVSVYTFGESIACSYNGYRIGMGREGFSLSVPCQCSFICRMDRIDNVFELMIGKERRRIESCEEASQLFLECVESHEEEVDPCLNRARIVVCEAWEMASYLSKNKRRITEVASDLIKMMRLMEIGDIYEISCSGGKCIIGGVSVSAPFTYSVSIARDTFVEGELVPIGCSIEVEKLGSVSIDVLETEPTIHIDIETEIDGHRLSASVIVENKEVRIGGFKNAELLARTMCLDREPLMPQLPILLDKALDTETINWIRKMVYSITILSRYLP